MASVFVVRSRRPLLHYYSYPARPGVPQDGEQPWRDPLNQTDLHTLRARGGKLWALDARGVYARGVTVDVKGEKGDDEGGGGPLFLSTGPCKPKRNDLSTLERGGTYECNNEDNNVEKNVCRRNRLFVRELYIDDSCVRDASKTKTKRACDQFFFFSLNV